MFYIDVTTEEWCKKHNLEPKEFECKNCKQKFMSTVPIIIKGYAGLEVPQHGCDRRFSAAMFKPITEEEKKAWADICVGVYGGVE